MNANGDLAGAMKVEQVNHDADLGVDEVWEQQTQVLAANKKKMECLRKQLQRQKQLEEAHLQEKKQKAKLARMEKEIIHIKQQRSVAALCLLAKTGSPLGGGGPSVNIQPTAFMNTGRKHKCKSSLH